jgi:phenylacetic acid degradation operon negative regulatory protein
VNRKVASLAAPEPYPRGTKVGLVPFLFAVAQVEELPGPALVRLLGDLGMAQPAARAQLSRMRDEGQLAASRHGRELRYRLAGPFADTVRKLGAPEPTPPWTNAFHALLYQVPEIHRPYRDRLRRIALLVGYGIMQQGVLVATRDRTPQLAGVLAEAPPDCRIQVATIGLPTPDAADIARSAWNLDAVADSFRGHIATLETALETAAPPLPTAATLGRMADLLNAPYVDLIRDPGLPDALLPPGWPRPRLDYLMNQVSKRYLPPAFTYVHGLLGTP